jgi:hypothetical protein
MCVYINNVTNSFESIFTQRWLLLCARMHNPRTHSNTLANVCVVVVQRVSDRINIVYSLHRLF